MSTKDKPHVVLAEEVDEDGRTFLFAVYGPFPTRRKTHAFVDRYPKEKLDGAKLSAVPLWPPEAAAEDSPHVGIGDVS